MSEKSVWMCIHQVHSVNPRWLTWSHLLYNGGVGWPLILFSSTSTMNMACNHIDFCNTYSEKEGEKNIYPLKA
jgi:hypothetical protein